MFPGMDYNLKKQRQLKIMLNLCLIKENKGKKDSMKDNKKDINMKCRDKLN